MFDKLEDLLIRYEEIMGELISQSASICPRGARPRG